MRTGLGVRLALGLILAGGVLGCGSGRPSSESSLQEATITGVVKLRGKPVTAGKIIFQAANIERPTGAGVAQIGSDGSYTVRSLVGSNTVLFSGTFIDRDMTLKSRHRLVVLSAGLNQKDFDIGGSDDSGRGPTYPADRKPSSSSRSSSQNNRGPGMHRNEVPRGSKPS